MTHGIFPDLALTPVVPDYYEVFYSELVLHQSTLSSTVPIHVGSGILHYVISLDARISHRFDNRDSLNMMVR